MISAGDSTLAVENSELLIDEIKLIYNQPSSTINTSKVPITISKTHNQILLNNINNSNVKLAIYDLKGKILFKEITINNSNHSIDISSLNNGFYILSIIESKGLINYKFFK